MYFLKLYECSREGETIRMLDQYRRIMRHYFDKEAAEVFDEWCRYMSFWLNPVGAAWWDDLGTAPGTEIADMFKTLQAVDVRIDPLIEAHIKSEFAFRGNCYGDFLWTPYWRFISEEMRRRADYRCAECRKVPTKTPHVHHLHYRLWGREHRDQSALVVLCANCHAAKHARQDADVPGAGEAELERISGGQHGTNA